MKYALIIITVLTIFSCKKKDGKFKLDKIIFHSSQCFGSCPIFHLEVNKDRFAYLFAETVHKTSSDYGLDKQRMGYFTGKIDTTNFNKIDSLIQEIGIDTVNYKKVICCDSPIYTIIIYHNGKRKYLKSMYPPKKMSWIINELYNICQKNELKKTNKIFFIEK